MEAIPIMKLSLSEGDPIRESWSNYYEEEIKYIKESDVIKFLNETTNNFHKMLFQFIFETGARVSEALKVRFYDINFDDNTVKLITLKQKSKNIVRVVTLSDSLINKILLHEKKKLLKSTDFLFSKKTSNRPISVQAVNKAMKISIINILGPEYRELGHPHTLRHSRAVQLLNAGVDISKVKTILGHSNIINTLVYLKYANKELQESMKRANQLMGIN